MSTTEKAAAIRAELKKLGINSRQVSVKKSHSSIRLTIKDFGITATELKNITTKYEDYETCQATGEILSGGNTFVFVEFDWDFCKKLNNIFSVQFDNEPSSIDLFGLKLHKIDFGFRVEYRDQNNHNYGNIEGMGINVYERLLLMGKQDQCKMLFKVA